ncbi:MAG: 16S rRNA (uracil(1498)-N(3))-methyltransferase [Bryobacterales bacterium]|nr:16S rRNA (uracil(1498)-N(3))-methyltransferase [Bryobacterales bacterium]
MARRLFFVNEVHSDRAEISGEDAKHLTRVLRVEQGQRYEISDNRTLYLAEIETARKEHVVFRIIERLEYTAPSLTISLYPALIRFERFEWILEKATELGVAAITPFAAVRSEKGLDRASARRMARWHKIVLESSQQSRRPVMPVLHETAPFQAVLRAEAPRKLLLDEAPGAPPIRSALAAAESIAVLTGPEGGWTDVERAGAIAAGWMPVSLGPNILRAETAAIAALAVLFCASDSPR